MGARYGLEIRAAAESDAAGLASLLAGAGLTAASVDLAVRLSALRQERGAVLVALDWGPPSGLIALHWHHTLTTSRPVAQVDTLLVDAEARRRGIGRLLLKAGAQAARQAGCAELRLSVCTDQPHLRAFCAATGFTEAGTAFERPLRKGGGQGLPATGSDRDA